MKYWEAFLDGLLTAACIGMSVAFVLGIVAIGLAIASIPVALVVWLWMAIL